MTLPEVDDAAAGGLVWRHGSCLAVVESADRVAILDLARPAEPPQVLLGSAAVIWGFVDGSRTTSAVLEAVASSFGVEPAEVAGDVSAFLESLASAGLVELVGGSPVEPAGGSAAAPRSDRTAGS